MNNLKNNLKYSSFSHIYVEEKALKYNVARKILQKFKTSTVIKINHYKDVFNRKNQDFSMQKKSPKLILAVKDQNLIYRGAKVCEDFGNQYFYYTSSIMNCLYDCEYCYLRGMYPSANIVVFVNIEDVFLELEKILEKHPVYLCISYDTDLLAFENVTGFVSRWINFVQKHERLSIEIRTKSTNFKSIKDLSPYERVILAWTFSPEEISKEYEVGSPSFTKRLYSAKQAVDAGWKIRICFDPLLYVKDWKTIYAKCVENTFKVIPCQNVRDISVGTFRVSKEYFKNMKKSNPTSRILAYPFVNEQGVFTYSKEHTDEMMNFMSSILSQIVEKDKIFI